MSSKLSTSLRALKLHNREIGHVPHKPMWVLPDGSVAVKDGIELIVLGGEDFFSLVHHGSIDSIEIYGSTDAPVLYEDIGSLRALWPPQEDDQRAVSWSDLVEAEKETSSGSPSEKGLTVEPDLLPVKTGVRRAKEPPDGNHHVTPTTEARVATQVSSRIVPVPMIIETPGSSHPVFEYLKEKGGGISYIFNDGVGDTYRTQTYKRVRIGSLAYRLNEDGTSSIEMDPNRIDISSGPGGSIKRLHRSFSLFK